MESYDYIKHISLEDFKKLDINQIAYVQMNNGEIYMIDHPYRYNQNEQEKNNIEENDINIKQEKIKLLEETSKTEKMHKKRRKRKKNENNEIENTENTENKQTDYYENQNHNYYENYYKYDDYKIMPIIDESNYTLPNINYEYNLMKVRPNSVKIKNRGIKLFNEEWKDLQDYDFEERMKFYDAIPKRAKYWEAESYDPTKSRFQSNRIGKSSGKNNPNIYNYMPIRQGSFSDMEDNYERSEDYNFVEESQKNENYYNLKDNNKNNNNYNYGYPSNQINSQKDLYDLAFGPQFFQYLFNQPGYQQYQGYQPINSSNENDYYSQDNQDNNNINNVNDYYQSNLNVYNNYNQYQYYQNNYNDYYDPNSYYYEEYKNENENKNLDESEQPKEMIENKEIKEKTKKRHKRRNKK